MNNEIDYLTEDSMRFELAEIESLPVTISPLENLLNILETNVNELTGDIKTAYDNYLNNEIATMEL